MVSVPLNIHMFFLVQHNWIKLYGIFRWNPKCKEVPFLLNSSWKYPMWYIWRFGLYFSQPSQSEVHRFSVILWYILCISIPCHFKMMNCQPITEILVISPQVHDLAICTIIPRTFFSSSRIYSNIIFWTLFKLLFPVLCDWLFSFFFKWLTQTLSPSPQISCTFPDNHLTEVDLFHLDFIPEETSQAVLRIWSSKLYNSFQISESSKIFSFRVTFQVYNN